MPKFDSAEFAWFLCATATLGADPDEVQVLASALTIINLLFRLAEGHIEGLVVKVTCHDLL